MSFLSVLLLFALACLALPVLLPPGTRGRTFLATSLLAVALLAGPSPGWGALDNDRYDGNIYALYAGNGSLVPPRLSLEEAMAAHRVSALVYYLDDSAVSKSFAGVVSELQRVWGTSIELLPLVTDPLQGRADAGPTDPRHYWKGVIPQVVVIGSGGKVVFDAAGQVDIDAIHRALSEATGLPLPPARSGGPPVRFNELNNG